jgi:hypothetical protein
VYGTEVGSCIGIVAIGDGLFADSSSSYRRKTLLTPPVRRGWAELCDLATEVSGVVLLATRLPPMMCFLPVLWSLHYAAHQLKGQLPCRSANSVENY